MEYKTGLTNREVIDAVLHLLADKGPISQETSWSDVEILHALMRYRSKVISEKMRSRTGHLSRFNLQTIACIPLEKVDLNECPCAPESGCSFLKSKFKIPQPIGNLQSVVSLAGNIHYDYLQWERFEDIKNSRFKAERENPYYTLKDTSEGTFLYVYNDIHKEFITVTGIFQHPLEVQNFPNCESGEVDCCFNPMEAEFILDPELLPLTYDFTVQQLLRNKIQATDIYNNDQDDITKTQIPIK